MRSYPSDFVLNDLLKRNTIHEILSDSNMDLAGYMELLTKSIIKDKQVLTSRGKEILILPEHKLLYEKLKEKYSQHQIQSMYDFRL